MITVASSQAFIMLGGVGIYPGSGSLPGNGRLHEIVTKSQTLRTLTAK